MERKVLSPLGQGGTEQAAVASVCWCGSAPDWLQGERTGIGLCGHKPLKTWQRKEDCQCYRQIRFQSASARSMALYRGYFLEKKLEQF